ncbi:MAG: hypothetical protein ABIN89_08925 [Chitinophagaceae bacterium]
MTFEEFNSTLSSSTPPADLSVYLKVLWFDGKNDWDKAHNIAQDLTDKNGSWLHAYLHRKEGDISNAGYWYRKAGKPLPAYSMAQEWKEIVNDFL